MTNVGIIGATVEELRMFATDGNLRVGFPRQIGEHVWIVRAGMGAARAGIAVERLLETAGPMPLISWGTAGALNDSLHPGDILLPSQVIEVASGHALETEASWRSAIMSMCGNAFRINSSPLLQTDGIIAHPKQKRALLETHEAAGIDMESAAIAAAAKNHGLPFLTLRVIVDAAGDRIPIAANAGVDDEGNVHPLRIARALMRYPYELPALLALGRNFSMARHTLRKLARLALEGKLAPTSSLSSCLSSKTHATH